MIDLLRQIKNDLDAAGNVTSLDAKWLVAEVERLRGEVEKWDGGRDPAERREDYAELRTQLHTATGVSADVPVSLFGLVGVLIQQRDEARRVSAAVTGCPEAHPDRPDIRCTQDRHENGHVFHRNSRLGVEWWTSSAGVTVTVHDFLGPIHLGHPNARAATPTPAVTDSHAETPGRYHTLPPCEDDDAESEPSDPGTGADTQVYQAIVPVLEGVAGFLKRMGTRYRDGNHRMTSELCRTAETHSDTLNAAAKSLRDLVDAAAQAEQQRALAGATTVRQWLNAAQTYIEGG